MPDKCTGTDHDRQPSVSCTNEVAQPPAALVQPPVTPQSSHAPVLKQLLMASIPSETQGLHLAIIKI